MTKKELQIYSIFSAYSREEVMTVINIWIDSPEGGAFKQHGFELRDERPSDAEVILPWKGKCWVRPKRKEKKEHSCHKKITPKCPECDRHTVLTPVCKKSGYYKEGFRTLIYCPNPNLDECTYAEYTVKTREELVRRK